MAGSDSSPAPASEPSPPPDSRAEVPAPPSLPSATADQVSPPSPATPTHLPEELREAIRRLGKRPRADDLRPVIARICAARWTTDGELADWLDMNEGNLRKRHLGPMVETGLLESRLPVGARKGDQAYRAAAAPAG